jgi:hypothetical protein
MFFEPPGKAGIAAVTGRHRFLPDAFGAIGGAGEAEMEMVVVAEPGPDFSQPGAVSASGSAEFPLDMRIHEDTVDFGNGGRDFQELRMLLTPKPSIQAISSPVQQARGGNVGAPSVQVRIKAGIEVEPHVGIQAGLVAAVAKRHGAASGLGEIADLNHSDGVMDPFAQGLNRPDQ